MKKFTHWVAVAATALCITQNANADHLSAKYLFAARLDGAQEVPGVTTNALGVATMHVSDDMDTACFEMTVTGLSGSVTGVHIHEGAIGVSGPIVVDLMSYLSDNRVKGTITGSTLTPQLIAKLFSGAFYVNVHTAANPNGEIRGQLLSEEDKGIMTWLTGSEQVPPVTTSASGLGSFVLSKHQQKLAFHVVFDGLSSAITGAHLHREAAGQNGPVILDLGPFMNGNVISGSADPTAYLSALLADSIYINVHTVNNPGGEIRGQLRMQPYLHYDAKMDTAQETGAVTGANGFGVSTLRFNYTLDTAWYDAQVTGLSGAIQASHFHKAGVDVSGPVLVGIPNGNINGNMISGMITGTDLTDSFKRFLLEGNIYINVHTATNPAGEIRGQVYRTFREGYTYHINGAQEVPMVTSSASGTGMVSIDRDQTNAHYMLAVHGLTGYTAAHFHNQVPGQNGGVIFDLTNQYADGGISGYWTETHPTNAFNASASNKFRKDSIYVNLHTTANPNGEIRGNVSHKLCNDIPTSIRTKQPTGIDVNIYPNPAYEQATLEINLQHAQDVTVVLSDITGRNIWTSDITLEPGFNRIIIPLGSLQSGIYFTQIVTADKKLSYKLVKE